jgi:thioredoxin 1
MMKIVVSIAAVLAVAGLLSVFGGQTGTMLSALMPAGGVAIAAETGGTTPKTGGSLPTMMDLGSDKCMPCRMLAPVIEEIKDETAGRLTVVYHDVWKDPAPAREYGIYGIPTLIFLDENGEEIYRHMGYWSKEAILDKWKELGYDFR